MKKIAYFIDSNDPGGAETLVIDMCRGVKAFNFEPIVLHFGNDWLEKKCNEYNISNILVPGHKYYKSFKTLPIFFLIFCKFLKKEKIDLLHSHLFDSIIASSITTFIIRLPHIGTLHDIYTIGNSKLRVYMLKVSCFLGTQLITVSKQMLHHICSFSKFSNKSIRVIENGVDIGRYKNKVNINLRKDLNIDSNDVIIICVARLVEIKGHDMLIEAIKKLNKKAQKFRVLLVGEGPERNRLTSLISIAGLTDKITLLGQRDDIPDLLKMSDCFVLSSKSEGLSCSIIEAMAAGLPAVVTDVGGNRELVENCKNGFITPVNDSSELALKLDLLINDEKLRIKYGENSYKIVVERFSLDTTITSYIKYYKSMLE